MTASAKPPIWFWIVSGIALLWNVIGVANYLLQVTMSPEALAALPEAQQQLLENTPVWANAGFALAVWGGAIGSLFLLIRKSYAVPAFVVSLIGILIQQVYGVFLSDAWEVLGAGGVVLPLVVLGFGIFLLWFSRKARAERWVY
ncbi:MAG: hypothetical protein AAF399_30425 [Bacteroidota bacterium]